MAPLQSFKEWKRSIKNFEWLLDSIPGATDIDLLVERNHHFLVLESKPYVSGVEVPYGQHLALHHLSLQPKTTVYVVGERNGRLYLMPYGGVPEIRKRNGRTYAYWTASRFAPTTKDELREVVKAWWDSSSGKE